MTESDSQLPIYKVGSQNSKKIYIKPYFPIALCKQNLCTMHMKNYWKTCFILKNSFIYGLKHCVDY
jgi:hypothetical protein